MVVNVNIELNCKVLVCRLERKLEHECCWQYLTQDSTGWLFDAVRQAVLEDNEPVLNNFQLYLNGNITITTLADRLHELAQVVA